MTTHSSSTGMPTPPQIKGGEEVYNMIMKEIEPDLVSSVMDTLDEKYAEETEEEKAKRMKRYAAAFVEYEKQYQEYMVRKKGEVKTFGRSMNQSIEAENMSGEAGILGDLESQFSQTS
ncbi:MAG: hypothetical protein O3A80_04675 [bacterium]|nr:hypothetical protein [bacterium]MDA1292553.1 hypothetical protein [bacterium]